MDGSSQMKAPNSHGTMDESQSDSEDSSSYSSSYSSSLSSSSMSCASDDIDDYVSSTSLPVPSSATSSEADEGPLYQMDSLRAQLPFKRGLSKFFAGKSQSFTSLSNVRCLNDLVKPENPYKKKLKSSHSFGAALNCQSSYQQQQQQKPRCTAKKPHKGGNSVSPNKRTYLLDRPPVTPLKNIQERRS